MVGRNTSPRTLARFRDFERLEHAPRSLAKKTTHAPWCTRAPPPRAPQPRAPENTHDRKIIMADVQKKVNLMHVDIISAGDRRTSVVDPV